jgi:hypothetical protein
LAGLPFQDNKHLFVGDFQLRTIIIQKKIQEDPSTPLQNPQEEVEDP